MSDNSAYQGSQAFNAKGNANEYVSPGTGSLSLTRSLINLPGKSDSIGLSINLSYSQGSQGSFGLPPNWSFGIPYLIPNQSLSCQGKTYVIDPDWIDDTSGNPHQSGLKYVNNHGLKLTNVNFAELPSREPGYWSWCFKQEDGAKNYFDATGKLLEHDDVFGNYIYYEYEDENASPTETSITRIKDSWGQTVYFEYDPSGEITVTSADGGTTSIQFDENGVQSIRDAENNLTLFCYDTSRSSPLLCSVEYPVGLTSIFQYQDLPYNSPDRETGFQAAVSDHIHKDGETVLDWTTYTFSDNTFTGYSIGCILGGQKDDLIENGDKYYRYDVLIQRKDERGDKTLAASRNTYNFLHLLVQEDHYNVDEYGNLGNSHRAVYTYSLSEEIYNLPASYSHPTVVEQLYYNASSGDECALRKTEVEYNEYTNPTRSVEYINSSKNNSKSYEPHTKREVEYYETKQGTQLFKTETFTDFVTSDVRTVRYYLNEDETTFSSNLIEYSTVQNPTPKPWKTKTYEHNFDGRIMSEKVEWSRGVSLPPETIRSYTSTTNYSFDPDSKIRTTITTDASGNQITRKHSMKIVNGPIVETILASGLSETYQYDEIGRVIKYTDFAGNTTSTEFRLRGGANSSEANTITTTYPTGYVTQVNLDALNRLVEATDNGDPTRQYPAEPSRVLMKKSYNVLGLEASSTDQYNRKTTSDVYDSLHRLTQKKDSLGNVSRLVYDDEANSVEHYINGEHRATTKHDNLGRQISHTVYPDSSDSSIDYVIVTEQALDGQGNALQLKQIQTHKNGSSTVLSTTSRTYNAEYAVATEDFVAQNDLGGSSGQDHVQKTYTYDIFGNIYQSSKNTEYSTGDKFQHLSAISIFNECGLLSRYRNQLRQEEIYTYDCDGNLTRMQQFDGSEVKYLYNKLGKVTKVERPNDDDLLLEYLDSGNISKIRKGNDTVQYQYSLDGSLLSVNYPDGKLQKYVFSNTGQVIKEISADGTECMLTYDECARLVSRRCQDDTINYTYGQVNHRKGGLVSLSISGRTQEIQRNVLYNGYGAVVKTDVTSDRRSLVTITNDFDPRGRLVASRISSNKYPQDSVLNFTQKMSYDGLNQLIQDVRTDGVTGAQRNVRYSLDGNSNVLTVNKDGRVTQMRYNEIDQRTDMGFRYDTNGRLTSDEKGRIYKYGANDKLISIETGDGGESRFEYYPNSTLAAAVNPENRSKASFYYNGERVNSIFIEQEGWVSLLNEQGHRLAAYPTNSSASYSIEHQGSTNLIVGANDYKTIEYDAYGSASPSSNLSVHESFCYQQEYTDQMSGLIYLRSRFYHPDNMSFITMDRLHKDNRYAYCAADPINTSGAAIDLGTPVGVGIPIGTMAASTFGAESLSASLASVSIKGAASQVGSRIVQAAIAHYTYGPWHLGVDIPSGALGSLVDSASGTGADWISRFLVERSNERATTVIRATAGMAGGLAGAAVSDHTHRPLTGGTAPAFVNGAASDAIGAIILSWGGLPVEEITAVGDEGRRGLVAGAEEGWNVIGSVPEPRVIGSGAFGNEEARGFAVDFPSVNEKKRSIARRGGHNIAKRTGTVAMTADALKILRQLRALGA
ncbi:hypothetical protein TWF481_009831 [Arthrobotrys musiformis]|uniref:Teneurin-like YD-shell domain-containing protein n=1 Tax=Arthrobotrys musiformis TaxID=47236 RepID=A0AAV9W624_9PEZI